MKLVVIFLIVCLASTGTFAQSPDSTTATTNISWAQNLTAYERAVNGNSLLFRGSEYIEPRQTSDNNHPYYSEDWMNASIEYYGEKFENVPVLFDITNKKVVIEHPNGSLISLVNEKIDHFVIDGHRFVRMQNSASRHSLPIAGFYDVLYNGPSLLIALHEKYASKRAESGKVNFYYKPRTRYYIFHDQDFVEVINRKTLLAILADEKAELKQMMGRIKKKFSSEPSFAYAETAAYYDQLKLRSR